MMVELLLAWATGVHGVVVVFALASVAALIIGIVARFIVIDVEGGLRDLFTVSMRRLLWVALALSALTTIPTLDDLWRVRVGLLKLELASPENVKAVGGHVEEIVKALECKHLNVNCPKESK